MRPNKNDSRPKLQQHRSSGVCSVVFFHVDVGAPHFVFFSLGLSFGGAPLYPTGKHPVGRVPRRVPERVRAGNGGLSER